MSHGPQDLRPLGPVRHRTCFLDTDGRPFWNTTDGMGTGRFTTCLLTPVQPQMVSNGHVWSYAIHGVSIHGVCGILICTALFKSALFKSRFRHFWYLALWCDWLKRDKHCGTLKLDVYLIWCVSNSQRMWAPSGNYLDWQHNCWIRIWLEYQHKSVSLKPKQSRLLYSFWFQGLLIAAKAHQAHLYLWGCVHSMESSTSVVICHQGSSTSCTSVHAELVKTSPLSPWPTP